MVHRRRKHCGASRTTFVLALLLAGQLAQQCASKCAAPHVVVHAVHATNEANCMLAGIYVVATRESAKNDDKHS